MRFREQCAWIVVALLAGACADSAGTAASVTFDSTTGDVSADVAVDTAPTDATSEDTAEVDTTPTDVTAEVDTVEPPASCATDADCDAPEICIYVLDEDGGGYSTVCGEPVGPNDDTCASDADCERGLCVEGACVSPCQGTADCPGTQVCGTADVTLPDDGSTTVPACVPRSCESRVDCTEAGEACVVDRSGDALVLGCVEPVGEGGQSEGCSEDADCASGLCLDGQCAEPCVRSNDCSEDGTTECARVDVPLDGGGEEPITLCQDVPPDACTSDAQCTDAGERCVASKSDASLDFVCGTPNASGGENGDACGADADCAQNLCVDGLCAGPCQVGSDCDAEYFQCALVDVTLAAGSDSANLCQPPVFCDEPGDCLTDVEVCFIRRELRGDLSEPTLALTCEDADPARRPTGEACSDDSGCASNFCFEGRFGDVCANPCVDNSDCDAGFRCEAQTVSVSGQDAPLSICVPVDPPTCVEASDCDALTDTTCAVVPTAQGDGLEAVCVPRTGGNNGQDCASDDACKSGVCFQGSCADLCDGADAGSCGGAGQVCRDAQTVSKDGLSGVFDLCETLPDVLCGGSPDCAAADGIDRRVCGARRVNDTGDALETVCVEPNPAGDGFGASCTTSTACRDKVCFNNTDECSVYCTEDSHCDPYESGGATVICSGSGFNPGPTYIGHCVYACGDDGDCAGRGDTAKVCSTNTFRESDGTWVLDTICEPPAGAGDLGASCTSGSECISGLCLTTFNGTTCSTNADCSGDFPLCVSRGTGSQCATRGCTRICDTSDDSVANEDCLGGVSNNGLTTCSNSITIGLPEGGSETVSACSR